MSFKNLFIAHDVPPEVTAWIEEEAAEQEVRYQKIAQEMEDKNQMSLIKLHFSMGNTTEAGLMPYPYSEASFKRINVDVSGSKYP